MTGEAVPAVAATHAQPRQIPSLQILRFLAAFAVVLFHIGSGIAVEYKVSANPLNLGAMGVDVFFVLSGFIIAYTTDKSHGVSTFLRKRIARVVPLYWLLTLAVIAIGVLKPSLLNSTVITAESIVKSFLFIPYSKPNGAMQPLLFLGWTLCYEMFFYAIYSVCMLVPKWTNLLCCAVIAGLVTLHTLWPSGSGLWQFYTNPILLEFVFGILLCKVFIGSTRFDKGSVLGAILVLACAPAAYSLAKGLGTYATVLAPGLFATLVVAAFLLWRPPQNKFMTLLVVLGNASYSLYLIHPYFIQAAIKIFAKFANFSGLIAILSVVATLTMIISVALYTFVERPLQKRILGFRNKRPVVPVVVAAPGGG